ncbi:hypothetical protein AURDEDRAFT_17550, partial [Auricularia subglabra TFB-10046 SS5]
CNVGASVGHVAMTLLNAHSHLNAVVQDLPPVIAKAKEVWERDAPKSITNQRVQFVPVDFIAGSPVPGCDFYYV